MVYCKKCARLLDSDVRICPYCNNEDENFVESESALDRLRQIDEQIEQNLNPPQSPAAPEPAPEYSGVPYSDAPQSDESNSLFTPATPYEPTSPVAPYTPVTPIPPAEAVPGTGLYVGMVILSIFLNLPGLIIGIVYMTNKSAHYRKMGLVMIIVSIVVMVLGAIACCAMLMIIGADASSVVY